MKILIARTALLLATVFTFGYTRAAEPLKLKTAAKTTMERALDRQLNKYLSFPISGGKEMLGEVTVSFVVNAEGHIQVLDATGTSEALRAYVLRKLSKVDIGANPEGVWKTSHIRFVFRPEA